MDNGKSRDKSPSKNAKQHSHDFLVIPHIRVDDQLSMKGESEILLPKTLWERVLMMSPYPTIIIDTDFRFLWMNKAFTDTHVQDTAPMTDGYCYQILCRGRGPCRGCPMNEKHDPEVEIIERSDEVDNAVELPMKAKIAPIVNTSGKISYVVEYIMETSEQNRLAFELQTTKMKLNKQIAILNQLKISLRVLLESAEEEKEEIREKAAMQIADLVLPHLERLRMLSLPDQETVVIRATHAGLQAIFSSGFVRKLLSTCPGLTQRELQVASLVAQGLGNKEIADYLNISERAVEFHRYGIRKKLGLNSHKKNLQSFLRSLLK